MTHTLQRKAGVAVLALLSGLSLVFASNVLSVRADQDPATCNDNGAGISVGVFRADGVTSIGGTDTVLDGELIKYKATLSALGLPNCAFEGGTWSLTTPDGVVHNLGSIPRVGGTGVASIGSALIDYNVLHANEIASVITARTNYGGGISHATANDTTPGPVLQASKQTTVFHPGVIIVDKVTNPSGNAQSFAFTTGGAGYVGFSLTDQAAPNSQSLAAGAYSVSEGVVSGWTQTSAVCVSSTQGVETPGAISLQAGETVTCTFTNTLQPGRLIVQKTTLPGATSTVFNINATGTGTISGTSTGTVTDAVDMSYEVTAGTYSVSETVPAGWTQTSNNCTGVVVAAGETKTCVIVNTLIPVVAEYCSPGYWKQSQHFDSWVGYSPNQTFQSVFGTNITIMWSAKGKPGPVTNPTLLQVLEANGGGTSSLARAAVGALLNASALDSSLTTAQVIAIFNAAYISGDFEGGKAQYTFAENCPLN